MAKLEFSKNLEEAILRIQNIAKLKLQEVDLKNNNLLNPLLSICLKISHLAWKINIFSHRKYSF